MGHKRLVLMQCFERRCLTYTPGNPEGFVVEAGNVGQHYHSWRASPQQEVSIGDAPQEVQDQLQAAADDNLKHRQLFQYLIIEGFATVGRSATAISGPGLLTTDFLSIEMETSPPNPLHATVIFDPTEDGEPLIYALVATAQKRPLYLLSVNSEGFVEALFVPPNVIADPMSAPQLAGTDPCDVCLSSCTQLPELRVYVREQSLGSCRSVAHAICGTKSENIDTESPNGIDRWFFTCVMIVASRCLEQAQQSTCEEICYFECATCDFCSDDDPANFCCEGSCTDLTQDANNCGACGERCFTGQACCNGTCIDILSDSTNCGACGISCPDGQELYQRRLHCGCELMPWLRPGG